MTAQAPLIIVGGGLAGAFTALLLAERRPELPVVLIEARDSIGGDQVWSFFDADIPPATRELVAALRPMRWPRHRVRFPERDRTLDYAYNTVSAPALDALVRARLAPERVRCGTPIQEIAPDAVVLATGERLAASGVIDARGFDRALPGLELGWQKFVGIELAATAPDPDCAMVMDATVPQLDGYRFVYVLPFAAERVLVEDTYYSNDPVLDVPTVASRVRKLAAERGLLGPELRREQGVLPILIGGDPALFWPKDDPIPRIGLRGGFFQATTGYSFGLALQIADELSAGPEAMTSVALTSWTRARFLRHWREGSYYRLLNRMLFHAGDPARRYQVLSHFYRLPTDLVERFYAGRPNLGDKLRILTGRPPVPLGAAIRALLRR